MIWSGQRVGSAGHGWNAANHVGRLLVVGEEGRRRSNWTIAYGSTVVWLTQHWTADEMTRFAAQNLYVGRGAFGFAAGAQAYFGHTLSELTPAELALLGAMPRAPSRDPLTHAEEIRPRRDAILRALADGGLLSPEELQAGLDSPLIVLPRS